MGGRAKTFSREVMRPVQGTLAVMQYCLPDQLEIDPRYQRSIDNPESQALIAEIALNWHWGRAQVLAVSRREGRLFVVDGQHRLAAARLRGDIQQLPCLIEEFADVAEEAQLFNDLNDRRRPVSAIDKFRAALVAGDESCTAIAGAMERAGLTLAPHGNPNFWQPGQIANVGGIRGAWKTHGPAATELAMTLMADAFKGEVLHYAGTIFPGLVAVCAGKPGEDTIDDEGLQRLIAALGRKSQLQWRAAVLKEMAATGVGRVVAMTTALLREALGGAGGTARTPASAPAPVKPAPLPVAVPGGGLGFGAAYDRRAKGDQFCAQCDKLKSPEAASRCQSAWCKLRDVPASSSAAPGRKDVAA